MKIFNRGGDGAAEIVEAIGIIGADVDFSKWQPLLPFGLRDVAAIIGHEPVVELCKAYKSGEPGDAAVAVSLLQQSVAFFTWLKIIPTLDAQHDSTGRARRIGENEKGLTALEQFKDEENIRRLAYEAVDALVEELEAQSFDWWRESRKCQMRDGLFLRCKADFDEYYNIGSHRLYMTLLPMIREVQRGDVLPVLGTLSPLMPMPDDADAMQWEIMCDESRRAVALLTMKKAVERLPVEVLPEGIVQVQQSQPVKQRLKAEREARVSVAAALGDDARRALERLAAAVAQLTAEAPAPTDDYVPGPIVHSKGMSF